MADTHPEASAPEVGIGRAHTAYLIREGRQAPDTRPMLLDVVGEVIASFMERDTLDHYRRERAMFESGEVDRDAPGYTGHYEGCLAEAEEFVERLQRRGFSVVAAAPSLATAPEDGVQRDVVALVRDLRAVNGETSAFASSLVRGWCQEAAALITDLLLERDEARAALSSSRATQPTRAVSGGDGLPTLGGELEDAIGELDEAGNCPGRRLRRAIATHTDAAVAAVQGGHDDD